MSDLESRIGQRALARGWITDAQLQTALRAQTVEMRNRRYVRLGEVLVGQKVLQGPQVAELLADQGIEIARANGSNVQYNIVNRDPERLYHCPKDGIQLAPVPTASVLNVKVRGTLHRGMGIVPGADLPDAAAGAGVVQNAGSATPAPAVQVAPPSAPGKVANAGSAAPAPAVQVAPARTPGKSANPAAAAPAPSVQVAPARAPGGVSQRKAAHNDAAAAAARSGPLPSVGSVPTRSSASTNLPAVGSGSATSKAKSQPLPTIANPSKSARPGPPPGFPHLHARPAARDGKRTPASARNPNPAAKPAPSQPPPPPPRHAIPPRRTPVADTPQDGLSPAQMPSLASPGWEGAEVDDNGKVTLPESFASDGGHFGDYPSAAEVPVEVVEDSSTISPTIVDEEEVDVSNLRISKPSLEPVGDTPTTPGLNTAESLPARHSTPAQVDLSIPDPQEDFMFDADVDPWGEPDDDFPQFPDDGNEGSGDEEWDAM